MPLAFLLTLFIAIIIIEDIAIHSTYFRRRWCRQGPPTRVWFPCISMKYCVWIRMSSATSATCHAGVPLSSRTPWCHASTPHPCPHNKTHPMLKASPQLSECGRGQDDWSIATISCMYPRTKCHAIRCSTTQRHWHHSCGRGRGVDSSCRARVLHGPDLRDASRSDRRAPLGLQYSCLSN